MHPTADTTALIYLNRAGRRVMPALAACLNAKIQETILCCMSSLVTAALTAFFGVLVIVLGQLAQKFILEPIQEQRKVIGEIAYSLLFHANAMDVSKYERDGLKLIQVEEPLEVVKTLGSLAGKLRASLWTIPWYSLFARLKIVPKEEAVMAASQSLVGWSNSIHSGGTDVHRKSIAENLRLKE